ncbi:hypothetical protein C5167_019561 [Papaver somniferum]|uniref:Uncharacterized protein n=1 Tax=Papaver somniferum TaxID=3469 RepID=A0A4Y7IUM4_PAPSO|nr:hypothetical protein C5167_019561 [Papaver somniferum]
MRDPSLLSLSEIGHGVWFEMSLVIHTDIALADITETSGVPKQSQAQHEMLNMLKPWLFLQPYYGLARWNYSLLRTGLELLPTLSMLLSLVFSGLLSF